MSRKVILAGGSGFLGQALARRLVPAGWDVVILSRGAADAPAGSGLRAVAWDGATTGPWVAELAGADAVVNLAGRSINCVHTPAHQREILESRVRAVQALGAGFAAAAHSPSVWIQCSAVGYYGDTGDRLCTEDVPAGPGFLPGVCQQWEQAFHALPLPGVRRVVLRLGTVFDATHGALPELAAITRRGLGGAAGSGRQYVSWIHRADVEAAFLLALAQPALSGTYNLCAPGAVTNAGLMRELRRVLHRPWVPPAPAWVVRLVARHVLRTDPALALEGQRASPQRLEAAGMVFAHPALGPALRDLLD